MKTNWQYKHELALSAPAQPFESALVPLIKGWMQYADAHAARYESPIGDDYVLGDHWKAIGEGLLGLLNGELDNLDAGSLDAMIRAKLSEAKFDADNL